MITSETVVVRDDPYVQWEDDALQFRLTYEGPLVADNTKGRKVAGKAANKHYIRKRLHPQLRRLWAETPFLADAGKLPPDPNPLRTPLGADAPRNVVFGRPAKGADEISRNYPLNEYRFVPLVREEDELLCSLDILFLRFRRPGSLVQSGDLDNRLKTLIDGLQRPTQIDQLGGHGEPDPDERPFFVLLENDKLITRISLEADTLLEPLPESSTDNDARVVITVKLQPYHLRVDNIGFG